MNDDVPQPVGFSPRAKLSSLFSGLKRFFLRKLFKDSASLEEKLIELVETTNDDESSSFGAEEKEILINAVNFTDTKVEDVMIPRTDIVAVKVSDDFETIKKLFQETGFTRIPVYDESLDNIKGFIHIKDLLPYFSGDKKFVMSEILRKAFFVPPAMKIIDLLLKMREANTRLALVVDEYGGTDGMATMEDLIEEIVGEVESDEIIRVDENRYEVKAKVKIDDVEEKLQVQLVEQEQEVDFETIGGLITNFCKKIPKQGEEINFNDHIRFHIKEAEARFIKTVIIETLHKND